jgi:hypothetical protein
VEDFMRKIITGAVVLVIGFVVVSNPDVKRWIGDMLDQPQPSSTTSREAGDAPGPKPKKSASASQSQNSPSGENPDEVRYAGPAWVVAASGQNGSSAGSAATFSGAAPPCARSTSGSARSFAYCGGIPCGGMPGGGGVGGPP